MSETSIPEVITTPPPLSQPETVASLPDRQVLAAEHRGPINEDYLGAVDIQNGLLWKAKEAKLLDENEPVFQTIMEIEGAERANRYNTDTDIYEIDITDENGNTQTVKHDAGKAIPQVVAALKKAGAAGDEKCQALYERLNASAQADVVENGRRKAMTLEQWEAAGKPQASFVLEVETKTAPQEETLPEDSDASKRESAKTSEVAETRENILKELQHQYELLWLAATEKIAWKYSKLPYDNQKMAEANSGYPKTVIQAAMPDLNLDRFQNLSGDALLKNEVFQLERQKRVLENTKDPKFQQRKEQIQARQDMIKGYIESPQTIDFSQIDKEFEPDGILGKPVKQAEFLSNLSEIETQIAQLGKQTETYNKGKVGSFTLPNGKRVDVTQSDLKSWGSNMAMVAGLSMLLMYMEGDKENQQQGRGGMH